MTEAGEPYELQAKSHLILIPGNVHEGHEFAEPGTTFVWLHFMHPQHTLRPYTVLDGQRAVDPAEIVDTSLLLPQFAVHDNTSYLEEAFDELLFWEQRTVAARVRQQIIFEKILLQLMVPWNVEMRALDSGPNLALATDGYRLLEQNVAKIKSARLFLSKRMGYSPDYIDRVFKAVLGKTSSEALADLRIRQAKELLATSELSIRVIASTLGYDDRRYFARLFKKRMGLTPTEYRAQERGVSY